MTVEIIPREDWSRIAPRRIELTTPKRCFCHHTVGGANVPDRDEDGDSGDDYLRIVEHVHINVNGWDDVAYNHFIDPIGLEIYEGQGWGREPNAQKGFNQGTYAVAIIGDFRKRHPDDYPGLLDRIAELVAYGQEIGELPDVPLEGHRDAPGLSSYICPGPNLYSALPEINRLIKEDAMPLSEDDVRAIWRREMRDDVSGGSLYAETQLRKAREDSFQARVDAAVTRRIVENMNDPQAAPLTPAQIEAIAEEFADEFAERLGG